MDCDDACLADLSASAAAELGWREAPGPRAAELERELVARGLLPTRWPGWDRVVRGEVLEVRAPAPSVDGSVLVRGEGWAAVHDVGRVCALAVEGDRVALAAGDGCDRVEIRRAVDWTLVATTDLPFEVARVEVAGPQWVATSAEGAIHWHHEAGDWVGDGVPSAILGTLPHERGGLVLGAPASEPATLRLADGTTRPEPWGPCAEAPWGVVRRCRLNRPEEPGDWASSRVAEVAFGTPAPGAPRRVEVLAAPGAEVHVGERIGWAGADGRAAFDGVPPEPTSVRVGSGPWFATVPPWGDAVVHAPTAALPERCRLRRDGRTVWRGPCGDLPTDAPFAEVGPGEHAVLLSAPLPGDRWRGAGGAIVAADGTVRSVRAGRFVLDRWGPVRECVTVTLSARTAETSAAAPCPGRRIRAVDLAGEPIEVGFLDRDRWAVLPREGLEIDPAVVVDPPWDVARVADEAGWEVWHLATPPRVRALSRDEVGGDWEAPGDRLRPGDESRWPGGGLARHALALATGPVGALVAPDSNSNSARPPRFVCRTGSVADAPLPAERAACLAGDLAACGVAAEAVLGSAAGAAHREGPAAWRRAAATLDPLVAAFAPGWQPLDPPADFDCPRPSWPPPPAGGAVAGRWVTAAGEVLDVGERAVGSAPIRLGGDGFVIWDGGALRTVGPDLALLLGPRVEWLVREPGG